MKFKNIAVLYKESAYSIYLGRTEDTLLRSNGPFRLDELCKFQKTHQNHYRSLEFVEGILKKNNFNYKKFPRGSSYDFNSFDLIITVGGDGTFLEAAQHVRSQLILGFNSDPLWSVGRFCSATTDNFEKILGKIISGRLKPASISRIRLQAAQTKIDAINDFLICHANPAAMSRYSLQIGRYHEEQKSSGLWISSAVGSSGAIHSAGGQVLSARSQRFQYMPRELYFGKDRTYRLHGGILSAEKKIKITSLMREGKIYIDGSHFSIPFPLGNTVFIDHSPNPLKIVGL